MLLTTELAYSFCNSFLEEKVENGARISRENCSQKTDRIPCKMLYDCLLLSFLGAPVMFLQRICCSLILHCVLN